MSKVTGLHCIFRKNSIYRANIGFHTLTFAWSLGRWRCFKPRTTDLVDIEGHLISQVYMEKVLRSIVLPVCTKTSGSTRPRMTMPEHTTLESAILMLCASTGHFAHQTCLQHFWTEGPTHNNGIKNPASRCSVAGNMDADPPALNHQYSKYTKPVLVLICG